MSTKNPTDTFSKWLKKQLHNARIGASELAEKAGISRAASYYYVSGERVPNLVIAQKIADALGIGHSELPQYEVPPVGRPKGSKARRIYLTS